jgi:hypothetical protein
MGKVRRGYIYIVSFVGLQSVAWAVISLLRDLLVPGKYTSVGSMAWQIALIIIGLPIYVVHWLWAQRLARREPEERESVLRRLYTYGAMGVAVAVFVSSAFELLTILMRLALGTFSDYRSRSPTDLIIHYLVAVAVMALTWFYHRRVLVADTRAAPETGGGATVRRLYLYGFTVAGLTMTIMAAIALLEWLMVQIGGPEITGSQAGITREIVRLVVGVPLWLIFWTRAQRLFASGDEAERASVVRKLYLYVTVFIAVMAVVTATTFVLAGGLSRLLAVTSGGDGGDIREALAIIIPMGLLWVYHAYVLRRDAERAEEQPGQAWVRQLYRYLVADVGLGAVLIGLGGIISVLIRYLSGARFLTGIPEEVAWFTALLIAGLPVWILPWRQAQIAAGAPGRVGEEERGSIVRKIYLYFYLFIATMTMLSSGVYIVYRLISLLLGERGSGNLLADLGQAIAFSLIAVAVWLYHGSILRREGRRAKEAQAERLASLRVTVMDADDGSLGRALVDELGRALPGIDLHAFGLTPEASEVLGTSVDAADVPAALAESAVIIGPWVISVAGGAGGAVDAEIARAVNDSPARKLLIPVPGDGWEWVGVDSLKSKEIVRQAVQSVRQIVAGEAVKQARRMSAGAIAGLIFGVLFMLIAFVLPLLWLLAGEIL